jgi:hypothetical protein
MLLAVAVYFAWHAAANAIGETATLYAPGVGIDDHYTRLWLVEDRPYVWIRAEKPTRSWLPAVRANPNVTLTRHGHRAAYHATVREDPESVAFTNALFRRKYGLADEVRELLEHRDPVPIRLEPK